MARPHPRALASRCPCGSGATYATCCRPFHVRDARPPTAEALMRSRYSAYAKRNPSYLSDSWHPDTRPPEVTVDRDRTWTGLRILASSGGGETDAIGIVEFIATSTSRTGTSREPSGSVHEQHEVSRFERFEGRWVYVSED